jgi:hypothetical protein
MRSLISKRVLQALCSSATTMLGGSMTTLSPMFEVPEWSSAISVRRRFARWMLNVTTCEASTAG